MKHYFRKVTLSLLCGATLMLAGSSAALAAAPACNSSTPQQSQSDLDLSCLPHPATSDKSLVSTAISFFFAVLGAVSLIVITFAGFKYVVSRGDPQNMAKAKNTILYALIGLAVAVSAQVIVSFVINRVSG